jgi:hypothetical protein
MIRSEVHWKSILRSLNIGLYVDRRVSNIFHSMSVNPQQVTSSSRKSNRKNNNKDMKDTVTGYVFSCYF